MIKHIVMFKFLDKALGRSKQENLEITASMLKNLLGVVPTLLSCQVEYNAPEADSSNYDLILITEHKDFQGLHSYIEHPEHKKVGVFMKQVRESRTCVDYYFEA